MIPKPGSPVRGSRTGRPLMALLDLLGRRWALRIVGAAPRTADLRRAAGAMRRDVAQRAESAYRRAARNGHRRARRRRLSPDGGRQRPARFDSTARRLGQTMGPAAWLNGSLVLVLH